MSPTLADFTVLDRTSLPQLQGDPWRQVGF